MKEKDHQLDDYFECYKDVLFRHVRTFVDHHTAEDICQETFLRLSENLDHVHPKMVKAWLFRVSKRLALDYLKKGGKYQTEIVFDQEEMDIIDVRSDTERIVTEAEESREKRKVLESLEREKPEWFDALFMRYKEHMSDREIGEAMGVKPSLVGQWRRRARRWLMDRYSVDEKEK